MPIYEYVCSKCGHEWDAIQKFSEKPITTCPKCSKKAAKRKISASAFHLKGSGWYVTDYKKGGASKESGDSASESSASDTKSEAKGDSKSESKTGSKPEAVSGAKADTKSESKAETKSGSKPESGSGKKKKSKTAAA